MSNKFQVSSPKAQAPHATPYITSLKIQKYKTQYINLK